MRNQRIFKPCCGHDSRYVWTATPCNNGHLRVKGADADDEQCALDGDTAAVRCCADQQNASAVSPSSAPCWQLYSGENNCNECDPAARRSVHSATLDASVLHNNFNPSNHLAHHPVICGAANNSTSYTIRIAVCRAQSRVPNCST
eukprot:gene21518-biopygen46803